MVVRVDTSELNKEELHKVVVGVMLLSQYSPLHKKYTVAQWYQRIVHSIELNQFSYYESENCRPVAFCNWAFLSEQNKKEILNEGRQIIHSDWQSGNHVFIPELIAPHGHVQEVVEDLRNRILKPYRGQRASTFRIKIDKKNRKLVRVAQSFLI